MTAELYQRAKAVFAELLELPEAEQLARLQTIHSSDPALEKEVRSLLEYHTAQSLVVPQPPSPRIRTRATLSTTYQSSSLNWMPLLLKFLAITIPLVTIALLISAWIGRTVHQSLRESIAARLTETVENRVEQLRQWENRELDQAIGWSRHSEVVAGVTAILKTAQSNALHTDTSSPDSTITDETSSDNIPAQELADQLERLAGDKVQFIVLDRRMIPVADWSPAQPGQSLAGLITPALAARLAPAMKGQPQLYLPRPQPEQVASQQPDSKLAIVVPITNETNVVIAILMLGGYGLDARYAQLLDGWAKSSPGETYMLNARGAIVSRSRYHDLLDSLDLATDGLGYSYPLARDAGVNLLRGQKSTVSPAAWPPTLLAREVTSGNNGLYVDSYRNYVGQPVVGAWRWLPDHEAGIAVEIHYDDAFAISDAVRRSLWGLNAFFAVTWLGLFGVVASRLFPRRRLRDLSEVGPYQVQEILGEGGMGRVYLAEHAFLCRQSAIKVLTNGATDLSILSRFEREVQLASQLTHPNTIAIYDFGRNKDGVFYYAMEYINGAHLGQLVEYAGPIEPGRCIFILQQLCRALMEAHQAGVVHRDIKPQNIMVCNRGGEPDFVKLFDYGLVKAFAPGVSHHTSQTKVVVGTPRFMAPERLNSPWLADPRVDIYSVGALAYYLLTGKLPPLVTLSLSGSSLDNEQPGIETLDLPPSVVEFGGILSVCLSVEPASRPSNMMSLLRELDALAEKFPWSRNESVRWWQKNEAKLLHLVHNKRKQL